ASQASDNSERPEFLENSVVPMPTMAALLPIVAARAATPFFATGFLTTIFFFTIGFFATTFFVTFFATVFFKTGFFFATFFLSLAMIYSSSSLGAMHRAPTVISGAARGQCHQDACPSCLWR